MRKSLYSLILMDDVVHEIDVLASKKNTNRSNLINQILADYVSLVTPEKRIQDIFNYVDSLLNGNIFNAYIEPYERTMSVKSCLDYKYRPTIKYEVELYRSAEQALGEIKIIFRTQSSELLFKLNDFFNLWAKLEHLYLSEYFGRNEIRYSFENGKFTRSICIPNGKHYSGNEIARAISEYIRMFDEIIKGYLTDSFDSVQEIESRYIHYLEHSVII